MGRWLPGMFRPCAARGAFVFADPAELERLALRAEVAATALSRHRQQIMSGGAATRWESAAASSFGEHAHGAAETVSTDGHRLLELAAALRRHAVLVQQRLEELAVLERRAEQLARQAADAVAQGVRNAEQGAERAAREALHSAEQVGGWVGGHVPW